MTIAAFETLAEQAALLRGSKLMDRGWYARRYPDAAALGMDPVEHYLRYGAALGRNPGPRFDTGFYRATYPDVAASGLNPLAHHLRHGARAGRLTRPDSSERVAARRALEPVRRKLLGFGFVARGLAELAALAGTGATPALRAHAARELALWHLRAGGPEAAAVARSHLPRAADCAETPEYFTRLAALELLCAHAAGAPEAEADAVLARAEAAGWALDDILLARAAFAPDAAARIPWINRALAQRDIAPVALAGAGPTPYDRLSCPAAGPALTGGPLVSVLVAAYSSAATLPTALAALQAQRWRNLEILVIDDASPDADTAAVASAFAAADPRIRLIRMAANGGAYVARNRGLAEAQGEFVTLHDADDWSHPDKIAAQADFLIRHPEVVGCTSERARATPDLVFRRMTGTLKLTSMNTSSFMFRRAYVRAAFGGWDTARFGADTELITRISHADGPAAVRRMETGPLSFQRVSDTSIVADAHFGISGTPFGARLIYHDLYVRRHREDGLRWRPDPARRPFPAPRVMRADRPAATGPRRCDLVFAGDLADPQAARRRRAGSAVALAAEIAEAADSRPRDRRLPGVRLRRPAARPADRGGDPRPAAGRPRRARGLWRGARLRAAGAARPALLPGRAALPARGPGRRGGLRAAGGRARRRACRGGAPARDRGGDGGRALRRGAGLAARRRRRRRRAGRAGRARRRGMGRDGRLRRPRPGANALALVAVRAYGCF